MNRSRRTAALAALSAPALAGIAGLGPAPANAAAAPAAAPSPAVSWQPCPQYSDAVLDYLRVQPQQHAEFRAIWARTRCGTISVPLDYRHPEGTRITIALTLLKAQDQAHRLGSLAMNPGGPGGSGYLMPATLLLANSADAQLNERYDLIGFDPRGVGYSTSYDCPRTGAGPTAPQIGHFTEAQLRQLYDEQAAQSAACSSSNPAFLSQLTTANAARDVDQIRRALGQARMSYFGASWGTQLGAVYRSMFPQTIGRMWLDSVVSPQAYDLSYRFDYVAGSMERDFGLFAQWLAARDSVYGLGSTPAAVYAKVLALREAADAHPWQFSDLAQPLDGVFIGFLASAVNLNYDVAGQVLAALTTAVNGGPAPAIVKQLVGDGGGAPSPAPDGAPARFNDTAGIAYLCNEDTSSRAFEPLWREYQRNLRANPVTGDPTALRPTCAGWTLPVQSFQLRRNSAPLQMSGHRYETTTPYPWVWQMQRALGGAVLSVQDFVHGSLPFVPACAAHLAAYFETGNPDNGTCDGMQPQAASSQASASALASSAASSGATAQARWTYTPRAATLSPASSR